MMTTSIGSNVGLDVAFDGSGVSLTTAASTVSFPLSQLPPSLVRRLSDRPRWQALEHLWADGIAQDEGPGRWRILTERLYEVPDDIRAALRLPAPARVHVDVRARGIPGHADFGIDLVVRDERIGTLEGVMPRQGAVYLPSPSLPILVPRPVFELLQLRDSPPVAPSLEAHLEYLAQVQRLAAQSEATVDSFIASQELTFPQNVGVEPEEENAQRIALTPRLDVPPGTSIPPGMLMQPRLPRVARAVGANGRVTRIVLSPDVRARLNEMQQRPAVEGSDVPRFLENPEAFLPPGLDLSEFSKRVIGFKTVVYNSRPYLHLKPSHGGWFEGVPGLNIEATRGPNPASQGKEHNLDRSAYRKLLDEARRTGDEFVRYRDGWVRVDPAALEQLESVAAKGEPTPQGTLRFPARAILDIYENVEELEFELPPAEALGLARRLSEFPDPPLPQHFRGELLPHQRVGYRWLAHLHDKGTGGLLADDMGLGKTVQVIAHLGRLASIGELKPSLIVCPKTIIENWMREFSRFLPGQTVRVYEGKPVVASVLADQDVVITSYDTLRHRQLELAKVDWQCVVCDEAQYAKNPTAQRTSAVKALKSHHRMALTGTPVENGLIEFWCILDFVRPGHLGSWADFRDTFERPLVEHQDEASRRPVVDRLLEQLYPHYLRRMKEEILPDLPPKVEREVEMPLGSAQFERYREIAAAAKQGSRGERLAAITRLLIVCAHPEAVGGDTAGFAYAPGDCPKLDATLDLLDSIRAKGEKALVFSRFLQVQKLLQEAIYQRFDLWPAVINGELTHNRQRTVDVFERHDGFNILILSHDVGGVGLNITGANHVVHYTRPWNPAKENQATDRAHRIGQTRPVTVYHPIVTDNRFTTVERRLALLLDGKRSLARDVLRPSRDMSVDPSEMLDCLDMPEDPR